jgi:hypothetical protein
MPWRRSIALRTKPNSRTMARIFADVKTTDEVVGMLDGLDPEGSLDNSRKAIDA